MKQCLYVGNIEQAEELVKESFNQRFNLCIDIRSGNKNETNMQIIAFLTENWSKFGNNVKDINVLVDYEKLPRDEFLTLAKFNEVVKPDHSCVVTVNHNYYTQGEDFPISKTWTVDTIIKANSEIDRVCDFIRKNNMSPLEALAFIHNYVANVAKYTPTTSKKNAAPDDSDQFFAGAYMDLPEVICMGFCDLEKEIIDTLNMTGLSCDIISVEYRNKKKGTVEDHARCFVKVADKRYGIFESGFDDPTWDNPEEGEGERYTHFMMPNDCMERKNNDNYDYYYPEMFKFSNGRATREIVDFEEYYKFNNSENTINQLLIEKIHMKILTLRNQDKNFEQVYETLKNMAIDTFLEEEGRGYWGYFEQNLPILTVEEARKIYEENHAKENTIER